MRYAETDQMGVVYYANFFVWFELGRVELFRQLGFSYREMEQRDDSYIMVANARCTYRRPARYDDLVRIRTRVAELHSRSIRFEYEVRNDSTDELLATGETAHVVCNRSGRPKVLAEHYRRLLAPAGSTKRKHE